MFKLSTRECSFPIERRKMWRRIGILKSILRFLFCCFLRVVYRVKEERKENLKNLKEHLKSGSIIFVFNHISLDDAPILFSSLYFKIGKEISQITIPASKKHWKSFLLGKLMRLSYLFGVEAFPVVQHYERDLYPPAEIFRLDKRFMRAAKQTLSRIGGVIVIAPEGHRGYGKIQPFQPGIKSLMEMAKKNDCNTLVAPVGIEAGKKFSRNINFGRRFRIRFGKPIPIEEIQQESEFSSIPSNELIREKVAEILPASYSSLN